MIEARKLTKHYGGATAVREASFSVAAGEVVGLLGPNGAGKTTLLRMLAGVLTPSEGEGVVAGASTATDAFRIKQRLGVVALWLLRGEEPAPEGEPGEVPASEASVSLG
jgi:ABC-type multidrug transport system ATPase subunit